MDIDDTAYGEAQRMASVLDKFFTEPEVYQVGNTELDDYTLCLDDWLSYDWGDYDMTAIRQSMVAANELLGSDECFTRIRNRRDFIFTTVVDPVVTNPLRWAELTSEKQAEWAQYRTDLLNVPQQEGAPFDVTWPTQPS
jgi:hypothetical protein